MKREERRLEQCGPVGEYRLKGSVAPNSQPGHCQNFKQIGRAHGQCINEQPLALFYGASDSQGGWRQPSLPEGGSLVPTSDTAAPGCRCRTIIDNEWLTVVWDTLPSTWVVWSNFSLLQ